MCPFSQFIFRSKVFVFFFGRCLSPLQMKSWIRICLPIYTLNELSFQEHARQDYCSEILFANMKIRYFAGKSAQSSGEVNEIVMWNKYNWVFPKGFQWQKYLSLQQKDSSMPPNHLLCKRPECYHSNSKTHVGHRVFKLSPNHVSVIYQIPWIR